MSSTTYHDVVMNGGVNSLERFIEFLIKTVQLKVQLYFWKETFVTCDKTTPLTTHYLRFLDSEVWEFLSHTDSRSAFNLNSGQP